MQATTNTRPRARAEAVLLLLAIALGVWCAKPAGAPAAYSAASAKPRPIPATGWHGRPIQRPAEPVHENGRSSVSLPASWDAGAVGYGTGYHHPDGSRRVREVQRRLTQLGYRTGPIDGLYGPRTRSAVQWFQIKHGLEPTGFVAATTLAALRNPGGFADIGKARAENKPTPATQAPAAGEARATKQPLDWPAPALFGLLAGMLLVGAGVAFSRRLRSPLAAPSWIGSAPGGLAIGYVSSLSVEPHAAVIDDACVNRGWALGQIVHDRLETPAPVFARPGLVRALERVQNGAANRLVVDRLEHLAGSLPELKVVLGWFVRAHIPLTAVDAGLDTDTRQGQEKVRAILNADRPRRSVETPERSRLAAGHGRPVDREELVNRIRGMRGRGMTLQAIADQLNEEQVPTARGGREWRRSSVNSLLGYRGPHPTAAKEVNEEPD